MLFSLSFLNIQLMLFMKHGLENRGWNTFFDSFTLVLSHIGQETLARDRVRKTLKARIWPFLKALLLSIGKEPEHCDSVEKGLAFLPMFMDKVVLIDTDSLYH